MGKGSLFSNPFLQVVEMDNPQILKHGKVAREGTTSLGAQQRQGSLTRPCECRFQSFQVRTVEYLHCAGHCVSY